MSTGAFASLNLGDHVGDDPAAVTANRATLAAFAGLPTDRLAVMKAAHGRDSAVADRPGTYEDVDILVTRDPDLAVVALAADCVPMALLDPGAGVAAAVQPGWRGVAADAAGAAVAAMVAWGTARAHQRPPGAAICPACYEVSEDVRHDVAASRPGRVRRHRVRKARGGLPPAVRQQLRRAGVTEITADPTCTFESQAFFSHRRDGVTGRHGVVVRLPESA